ncbi:MAG: hypothetical protein ACKE51_04780, partial [Methylococcaceae bacterium]
WFLTPCGQKNGALRLCLANFEMASTQSESTFCGPRSALCFSVQALVNNNPSTLKTKNIIFP